MKRSLRLRHLNRYKQIGLLALRYGDSEIAQEFGVEEALRCEESNGKPNKPIELANELERMLDQRLAAVSWLWSFQTRTRQEFMATLTGIEPVPPP